MAKFTHSLWELKESWIKKILCEQEPTPELYAILLVYWVQGILLLARLSVSFFLKDELALSPAEVAALMGVAAFPWIIKPLFGFISDGIPLFNYRRRPYLILAGLVGVISWVSMATGVHTAGQATVALTLNSLSVAFSDVIVDSLVVERTRAESFSTAGSLQSLCWGASAVGGLMTAYLSGYIIENFGNHTLFAITAFFPLLVSVVAWLIVEEKVSNNLDISTVINQLTQVRQALSQKSIWLPTVFIFFWQITPSMESAFFFFNTNELGFNPEFLGQVNLVMSIASLLGVFIFQRYLKTIPFRIIFAVTIVLSTVLGMTMLLLVTHANRLLGIEDHWFSLGDSLIIKVIAQIAFMPVLVLAARLCPPGVEATLFAILMAITNLAVLLSQELGSLLTYWLGITETNFDNLWKMVLISNLSRLLLLPLLGWLPIVDPKIESQPQSREQSLSSQYREQQFIDEFIPDFLSTSLISETIKEQID